MTALRFKTGGRHQTSPASLRGVDYGMFNMKSTAKAISGQNYIHQIISKSRCGGGGGGFFLTCEDFGGRFNDSFPACAFFFFLSGYQLTYTNSTFQARTKAQWLSESLLRKHITHEVKTRQAKSEQISWQLQVKQPKLYSDLLQAKK